MSCTRGIAIAADDVAGVADAIGAGESRVGEIERGELAVALQIAVSYTRNGVVSDEVAGIIDAVSLGNAAGVVTVDCGLPLNHDRVGTLVRQVDDTGQIVAEVDSGKRR